MFIKYSMMAFSSVSKSLALQHCICVRQFRKAVKMSCCMTLRLKKHDFQKPPFPLAVALFLSTLAITTRFITASIVIPSRIRLCCLKRLDAHESWSCESALWPSLTPPCHCRGMCRHHKVSTNFCTILAFPECLWASQTLVSGLNRLP